MAMASSLPTARFLYDYDWEMNVTCNLSNCTTPNSFCVYDSCLYFPLPPPPPTLSSHKSDRFFPNYFLITAASVLALFSFLLLLLLLFCRRRRGAHLNRLPGTDPPPHPRGSGVSDGDDGGGIHHVWLIRTVGLDDSVVRAIPAVIYKAGDGIVDDGKDCAVCLGEFADGETIKLLPKCSHAFHPNCIDTWLKSHVNCPLCRAPVTLESTQIGVEHQNQEEHAVAVDLTPGTSSSSSTELQPIRRSVSMDSLSVRRELELKLVENAKSRGGKRDDVLRKLGAEMKRSLSSRSGRLFFPRHKHGRHGRSASVLPL